MPDDKINEQGTKTHIFFGKGKSKSIKFTNDHYYS